MKYVAALFAMLLLLFLGVLTRVVGICYPVMVDNQPLMTPVQIVGVSGESVTLKDGRVLDLYCLGGDWENVLARLPQVDLEEERPGDFTVYVSRSHPGICGTPWAQPIRIPLIPHRIDRNRRAEFCGATLRKQ